MFKEFKLLRFIVFLHSQKKNIYDMKSSAPVTS